MLETTIFGTLGVAEVLRQDMKILAVDDDQTALDILTSVMGHADYRDIRTALSAADALAIIGETQTPFDCVLLDIRMPSMDGIELCRIIRTMPEYTSIPIIMLTAVTDKERLNQAIAVGATDYVNKPLNGLELGTRLRAASILSDVLKGRSGVECPVRSLDAGNTRDGALRLGDPVSLDPAPGTAGIETLREGLLRLPSAPYAMMIFALAIRGIEEIFNEYSSLAFRAFLNEVASRIVQSVDSGSMTISYAGDGVFQFVVHNTRLQRPALTKHRIRKALSNDQYNSLAGSTRGIRVEFGEVDERSIWTGSQAALALSKAAQTAKLAALEDGEDENFIALRDTFREIADDADENYWLFRKVMELDKAVDRIIPRRVKLISPT